MSERKRLQPFLLMLVYGGPLLVAIAIYLSGWRPVAEPHGELLDTPLTLPEIALTTPSGAQTERDWLKGYWSLIYLPPTQCSAGCIGRLNRLNQVRLALGSDMARAQVILMYTGAAPALPDGTGVVLARRDDEPGSALSGMLRQATSADCEFFVTDPLGRLAIAYAPDIERDGLLEDLERLLAVL